MNKVKRIAPQGCILILGRIPERECTRPTVLPGLPVFDPSGEISEKIAKKKKMSAIMNTILSIRFGVREKQVV
jgi:hypothetical protein